MARSPAPDVVEPVAPRAGGVLGRSLPVSLLVSLRPEQWTKNSLVFAGLIFGYAERYHAEEQLSVGPALMRSLAAFAIFCALSSVVYLLNDVADREGDRQHPLKCRRPIACGDLPVPVALATAAVAAIVALSAAFLLSPAFGVVALTYVSLVTLYSMRLKHVVILDVLTLSIGFVLRAV